MTRGIDKLETKEDVAKYVQTFCELLANQFEANNKHDFAQAFWVVYNEIQDGLLEEWDD